MSEEEQTDPIAAIWERVQRNEITWQQARAEQAAIVAARAPSDLAEQRAAVLARRAEK